ncbi:MAG TPA: SAM-dependent methyltransferase [Candidatus Binatia bacterium]|nr:SAM-dependent methyltransferase [Candidatus Binatia bacterium]
MAPEAALQALIREEIEAEGPISFNRFMEVALYCPNLGYYERTQSRIGKLGDYYTSVSVGPLFGRLLAFQVAKWLEAIPGAVQVVEAGAHDGRLARDILSALPRLLLERLEYWIIEPSENRQKWQRQTLNEFAGKVRWPGSFPEDVRGVIFSNEMLDSLPFKRIGWDAKQKTWFEWCVTQDFEWARLPYHWDMDPQFTAALPDGYTWEIGLGAVKWWRTAAHALRAGKLCAIDYFLEDHEVWRPERVKGTARAYRDHRVSGDLLANPGEQDITAHVHVTPLQTFGVKAGLTTEPLITQATFLTRILQQGARVDQGDVGRFKTLTHPEHLGERFKVLIQSRA